MVVRDAPAENPGDIGKALAAAVKCVLNNCKVAKRPPVLQPVTLSSPPRDFPTYPNSLEVGSGGVINSAGFHFWNAAFNSTSSRANCANISSKILTASGAVETVVSSKLYVNLFV